MPRLPRVHIDKALYFVTCKCGDGQRLFNDEADYKAYSELLAHYREEYRFKLFAYVLMPTCLHLLVEPPSGSTISTIMHSLSSNYTKYYNGRFKRKGHLFQGRFKAVIVEKEGYLADLTRYTHLCPAKDKVSDDFESYPYSSYGQYLNRQSATGLDISLQIKEVFSGLNGGCDAQSYKQFIDSVNDIHFDNLCKILQCQHYVGSKEFIAGIKQKIEEASCAQNVEEMEAPQEIIVRRSNPVFVAAGSLVIFMLSFIAFDLYKVNLGLQDTYETTTKEYSRQVTAMQQTIARAKEEKGRLHEIERVAWEIRLTPVGEASNGAHSDLLRFRNGRFISQYLSSHGYAPFEYQIITKEDGTAVWQTTQVRDDGTKISWYGVWNGKMIRGVLSERPVDGKNRDFSFVSTGRSENG